MGFVKRFFQWIRNFSYKTTIVLTGIGITLFMTMRDGMIGSIAQGGNSDVYVMSFLVWIAIMFIVIFFALILLVIVYNLRNIFIGMKNKNKNRRLKKQKKSN